MESTLDDIYYVLEDSRQRGVPHIGFGRVCNCSSYRVTKVSHFSLTWTETFVQAEWMGRIVWLGICNVKILYWSGLVTAVCRDSRNVEYVNVVGEQMLMCGQHVTLEIRT